MTRFGVISPYFGITEDYLDFTEVINQTAYRHRVCVCREGADEVVV